MPNTEFSRPNPLDSDVIMDATARLLAPRRPLLTNILPKAAEKPKKKKQPEPKRAKAESPKPAKAGQHPKGKKAPKKAEPAPQPPKKKGASKPQHRDRPRGMSPEPPRKNQPKDSTEQASLMKPYYLDMGR